MVLLLLLPPLLPLKLLLSSFLSCVHSEFFSMLQLACAYLPYRIEVFDLENLTLLLVILSTYTERLFLMYGDKITIILCFLSLIRFFFCSFPVHISPGSENCDHFVLFTPFLGEHVFHHVTGQQKVILCCEKSVPVTLGCFQVSYCIISYHSIAYHIYFPSINPYRFI